MIWQNLYKFLVYLKIQKLLCHQKSNLWCTYSKCFKIFLVLIPFLSKFYSFLNLQCWEKLIKKLPLKRYILKRYLYSSNQNILSVCLCVCLSVCLSICLSIVFTSVCQSFSLSVCQSFSLSVCQSVSLSVCQSVSLSVYQSVSLSVCQSVSLSVRQSVSLYKFMQVFSAFSSSLRLNSVFSLVMILVHMEVHSKG